MKNYLFIIIGLISINVLAFTDKDSTESNKDLLKLEKKLAYLEEKYNSGFYEEVVEKSKSFVDLKYINDEYKTKFDLLHVKAAWDLMDFSYAVQQSENFLSQVNSNYNAYQLLATIELFNHIGWYIKADSILNNSSIDSTWAPKQKLALNELRAVVYANLGFNEKSLNILDSLISVRKGIASDLTSNQNFYSVWNRRNEEQKYLKYSHLVNVKAKILVNRGSFEEAEKILNDNKKYISEFLGKSNKNYLEAVAMLGFMEDHHKRYANAAIEYNHAYASFKVREKEKSKVALLAKTIISYANSDQWLLADTYLRRLQAFAFQNVGDLEGFQMNYYYASAYVNFKKGYVDDAKRKLRQFFTAFNEMPLYHEYFIKMKELESYIADKEGDLVRMNELEREIAEIKATYYGKNSPLYHQTLMLLAVEELHYGKQYEKVESVINDSYYNHLIKEVDTTSIENIAYLNTFAELYEVLGDFKKSETYTKQIATYAPIVYEEFSCENLYYQAYNAFIGIQAGNYKESLELYAKLVESYNNYKKGNVEYKETALILLSKISTIVGDYGLSQNLLRAVSRLERSNKYEMDFLLEAYTSEQNAAVNFLTGNYSKAERYLLNSIAIKEEKLKDDNPSLVAPYVSLGSLYLTTGDLSAVEKNMAKALMVIDNSLLKYPLRSIEYLVLQGEFNTYIGDFKKAQEAYNSADNIIIQSLGKTHLMRAEVLMKQAQMYFKDKKVDKVSQLYNEALKIIENSIGKKTPLFAILQQKYAEFYISQAKYDKANTLLKQAEAFWKAKIGDVNKYVAEIKVLEGNIAYVQDQYDVAESAYNNAKSIYNEVFDDKHFEYLNVLGKLARVQYMKNKPSDALELLDEVIPQYLDYTEKYFPSLSFRQKSKYWNSIKEEFELYAYIALNENNPQLSAVVYNNILSTKAILLSSNLKLLNAVMSSNDSTLISTYNEWVNQKEYLISVFSLTKQQQQEQNIKVSDIELKIEKLEKEMSQRSELFKDVNATRVTWNDIKSNLLHNEYAIEVLRLRKFDKIFTDSIIYATLIVDKNSNKGPVLVWNTNGNLLETKYFNYFRNIHSLKMEDRYSYNKYWAPIKQHINDGATVFLSLDGVYNQLNIEMLKDDAGEYAINKNDFVYLTNSKDLLSSNVKVKKSKNKDGYVDYVLCGNPQFYFSDTDVSDKTVSQLEGSEIEVKDIAKQLDAKKANHEIFINQTVLEDTIKHLQSPKLLHIATHGYFIEKADDGEDNLANNPLLNSGLMLYGAGEVVDHPNKRFDSQRDGILTAYEAMNLKLDKTDLVVLSACETAKGKVTNGEGVYGLQRSFLLAGSKAVILSLFKVDDAATNELMTSFYRYWLDGKDKRTAFVLAKKDLMKKFPEPIYWGAFILIEGKPERIKEVSMK